MPRTKVIRKKALAQDPDDREKILQDLRAKKDELVAKLTEERDKILAHFQIFAQEELCSVPGKFLDMTTSEIAAYRSSEMSSVSCISKTELLNITKTVDRSKAHVKRSRSVVDDEGYLTAESVNSGGRKSRSRTNTGGNSTRRSRSLSTRKATSAFKTPANKVTPNSYGVVTPKCKPNMPQVILRRPQNGEVALSMQGSPLLTGTIATEKEANINIPLEDGRVMSLQPKRGLRMSQVPEIDPQILKQLQTLSENLNKVFAAAGNKI